MLTIMQMRRRDQIKTNLWGRGDGTKRRGKRSVIEILGTYKQCVTFVSVSSECMKSPKNIFLEVR